MAGPNGLRRLRPPSLVVEKTGGIILNKRLGGYDVYRHIPAGFSDMVRNLFASQKHLAVTFIDKVS